MSGVITNGVQWEHCNHCGDFVKLHDLHMGYSPNWPEHDAVDLCPTCYAQLQAGKFPPPPPRGQDH